MARGYSPKNRGNRAQQVGVKTVRQTPPLTNVMTEIKPFDKNNSKASDNKLAIAHNISLLLARVLTVDYEPCEGSETLSSA